MVREMLQCAGCPDMLSTVLSTLHPLLHCLAARNACLPLLHSPAALPGCTPWLPLLGLGLTRVADDHEAPVQRLVHRHKDEILGKQVNILRQEAARQATNEDK